MSAGVGASLCRAEVVSTRGPAIVLEDDWRVCELGVFRVFEKVTVLDEPWNRADLDNRPFMMEGVEYRGVKSDKADVRVHWNKDDIMSSPRLRNT